MDEKEKDEKDASDLEDTGYCWIDPKTGIGYVTDKEAYEAREDDD